MPQPNHPQTTAASGSPLVDIKGLEKRYGATAQDPGTLVLKDLDFRLSAGEAVAVVGASGSGKSTFLNILGTLDHPSAGTVQLNGRDPFALKEAEQAALRGRELGFIFQLHHLLPQCTVLENVLVPTLAGGPARRSEEAEVRARRLLKRVGLAERLDHRPGQLSGGERQRAAVVRALINEPKLLLADEPTGSLDRVASDNLARLLVELNQEEGVALVVITHSMALARTLGKVLEMRDGRLFPARAEGGE